RDRQAERLGRLEVDDQLELRGFFDGQVGRLGALEDTIHGGGGAAVHVGKVGRVGREAPCLWTLPPWIHCRQAALCCMVHDASTRLEKHRARKDEERVAARFPHCGKRSLQIVRPPRLDEL